jgi:hypothetical protein
MSLLSPMNVSYPIDTYDCSICRTGATKATKGSDSTAGRYRAASLDRRLVCPTVSISDLHGDPGFQEGC